MQKNAVKHPTDDDFADEDDDKGRALPQPGFGRVLGLALLDRLALGGGPVLGE